MPAQAQSLKEVFLAALTVAPAERAAWLERTCGDDAELRRRIELMLAAHDAPQSLFDRPAPKSDPPGENTDAFTSEAPGTDIGPYKLLQQIGEGGMGTVWMAQQTEPVKRVVALKLIKPGMDSKQVIARFEAERQALALMDHPNIAKVLDAGTTNPKSESRNPKQIRSTKSKAQTQEGQEVSNIGASDFGFVSDFDIRDSNFGAGRPYFVMELVKGIPITKYCDEHHLTPRQRLELFVPICHAIQHAHQKGVIHRDLKPSNVLVALYDDKPVPRVIDFGVAKATGASLTEETLHTGFGAVVGTVEYMSPEQAGFNQLDVDTRSDIYSLGVLLYELLTGSPPFTRKELEKAGMLEMLRVIREQEPSKPSTKLSTAEGLPTLAANRGTEPAKLTKLVRGELDWIVMKALEKDRSRRYETANALGKDIDRYLKDEAVEACPPAAWYRVRKAMRKHRAAATTLAVIAATLLAATVISWSFAVIAHNAGREADRQAAAARASSDRERREKEQANLHLYVARMQTAQQAWRDGNIVRVKHLLDETRPGPDQTDLRGFEWHYLRRLAEAEPMTLRGQIGGVVSIALSSDGRYVASAGAYRWDERTRTALAGAVTVWELSTGRVVRSLSEEAGRGESAVALGAGGLLVRAAGRSVEVWDLIGDKRVATLPGDRAHALALSADEQLVGVGYGSGSGPAPVKVWNVKTGQLLLTLPGHNSYVYAAKFSPDGKRLATSGHDSSVKVWDLSSGKEALVIPSRTRAIRSVAFSNDGKRLAMTCDEAVQVRDADTGEELFSLLGHLGTVGDVAFSPDGKSIATAGDDHTVRVWDPATRSVSFTLRGHTDSVTRVVFSGDGTRLVSGSRDGAVKVWNAVNPEAADLEGHLSVAYSPDGRWLAHGGHKNTIILRDRHDEKNVQRLEGLAARMVFSADGTRLLTDGTGWSAGVEYPKGDVRVWDTTQGRLLHSFGRDDNSSAFGFSPDNKLLAITGAVDNKEVQAWDTNGFRPLFAFGPNTEPLALSPAGDRVAARTGRQITLWEVATGEEIQSLEVNASVKNVTFSADGQLLAAAMATNDDQLAEVIIFSLRTGKELFRLRGHATESIAGMAFSPDGQRFAVGTGGFGAGVRRPSFVRVWELRTGQPVLDLDAGNRGVWVVSFSPEGHKLACAGICPTRSWDATPSR